MCCSWGNGFGQKRGRTGEKPVPAVDDDLSTEALSLHGQKPAVRGFNTTHAEFASLSPCDLRDTAASLAVSAGTNVNSMQRMHGQKSAAMTPEIFDSGNL